MNRFALLFALFLSASAWAQATVEAPPSFRNDAEEQRFRDLTSQLRCVMCQNQSLADSNAQIAHDLRIEILRMMREGKSDAQIKQFLVERYTDFVLYQPEVKPMTWLLWFGPALVLLVGAGVVVVVVRKHGTKLPAGEPRDLPEDE
jgi:cytochrome c-type biogenesis protein CcmH